MTASYRDKRVLVTGAGGFIASHLVEALVPTAKSVRAFLRYRSETDCGNLDHICPDVRSHVEVVRGDLRDSSSVRAVCAGSDIVFHLGALGSVPYSFENPQAFLEVNVTGTGHLLDACCEASVEKLLFMSTSEVYGPAETIPIAESHALRPRSPYAASKIAGEKLVETYAQARELPAVIARCFNVYGPRQSVRNVLLTIIAQGLKGGTLELGNLDPVRDYNFVTDTVSALMRLAAASDGRGDVFNVATGIGTSVQQAVDRIAAILGKQLDVQVDERRVRAAPREASVLIGDASKLRALTGWAPTVNVDEGLRRVVEWARTSKLQTQYAT